MLKSSARKDKAMSHTPGPWTSEGTLIIKFGNDGRAICLIADSRGETTSDVRPMELTDPDWKTGIANAHLIAAAPDLLSALEHVLDAQDRYRQHGGETLENHLWKMERLARAAIARAKGETTPA
jgi:hypothetical protein